MNFADLYRYSNSLATGHTPVELLRRLVVDQHPTVHDVRFWACDLDQNISRGHMLLELDRSSAYDDEFIVASIRFDRALNDCWRRFVCCKELMHVFDKSLERTSNKDRYLKLMSELENNPISVDSSPMFTSERNAEWMAILALCPPRLRDLYLNQFASKEIDSLAVAGALRIPEVYVRVVMSAAYDRAIEILTGEPANAAGQKSVKVHA